MVGSRGHVRCFRRRIADECGRNAGAAGKLRGVQRRLCAVVDCGGQKSLQQIWHERRSEIYRACYRYPGAHRQESRYHQSRRRDRRSRVDWRAGRVHCGHPESRRDVDLCQAGNQVGRRFEGQSPGRHGAGRYDGLRRAPVAAAGPLDTGQGCKTALSQRHGGDSRAASTRETRMPASSLRRLRSRRSMPV